MEVDRAQSDPIIEATLVVLAGGQSRRMGRPKALLPVEGRTLIEWLVRRLAGAFAETLVATGQLEGVPPALRAAVVIDRLPGAGPLAGIEAGLAGASQDSVFALACDVPNATAALARELLQSLAGHQAAVPVSGGRPHPTCAAYHHSALPAVTAALDSGEYRVGALLQKLDVVYVDRADRGTFANLNTPAEYQAFRRLRG